MGLCKLARRRPAGELQIWEAGPLGEGRGGGEKASAKLLCHCPPCCSHRASPHVLVGPKPDPCVGEGGSNRGRGFLPGVHFPPQGLPDSGGRGDVRLAAILDAVTEVRAQELLR